ncbi:MAG: TolC family protein [Acidobacteriia bacterium]|nr:TolC family protein [Terriglobia bacterium]
MKRFYVLLVFFWASLSMGQSTQPGAVSVPNELSFQKALELGLTNNPSLAAEQVGRQIARADEITAGLRPNPVFLLNSESYPIFTSHPGSFFNNQELVTNVAQEIETAGKRRHRIEVAKSAVNVSDGESEDARRRFRLLLAQSYFQAVWTKADLEVARHILSDFDQILKLMQERYRAGEISGLDLQRVEVERLRSLDEEVNAEIALKNVKVQVLSLISPAPIIPEFDVTDSLEVQPISISMEHLQQEAFATRADWIAQQSRLVQAEASIHLEEAQRTPNLSPFFGYKRDVGVNTASFGVQIALPLFNRNQGGIARAMAEKTRQQFVAAQLRNTIQAEVQQAYNNFEGNRNRVALLEKEYLPKARHTLDIVRQTNQLGAVDLTTFLDAQRVYRDVTRLYNRVLFETVASRYQLEAAVGKEF